MSRTLAIKYRPSTFDEVVEQDEIKTILQNQIASKDIKNAYLFIGGAGTGKTTCARIFANEVNNHQGSPIEIDGASNNGVDNVREISKQATTRATDCEYKIFIIDECHMISNSAWNAMLKLIEEPPLKTIFIFCTTNPEKIPKTILSRVQRYNFKRITTQGITDRLIKICNEEDIKATENDLNYLAKIANGHMRDALTMLDKVRLLNNNIVTSESITSALGLNSYYELGMLFDGIMQRNEEIVIRVIENCHNNGNDLKLLIEDEIKFVVDYLKWSVTKSLEYCSCPDFVEDLFKSYKVDSQRVKKYLGTLIEMKNTIKYDEFPKDSIESWLLLECLI